MTRMRRLIHANMMATTASGSMIEGGTRIERGRETIRLVRIERGARLVRGKALAAVVEVVVGVTVMVTVEVEVEVVVGLIALTPVDARIVGRHLATPRTRKATGRWLNEWDSEIFLSPS